MPRRTVVNVLAAASILPILAAAPRAAPETAERSHLLECYLLNHVNMDTIDMIDVSATGISRGFAGNKWQDQEFDDSIYYPEHLSWARTLRSGDVVITSGTRLRQRDFLFRVDSNTSIPSGDIYQRRSEIFDGAKRYTFSWDSLTITEGQDFSGSDAYGTLIPSLIPFAFVGCTVGIFPMAR